MNLFERIRFWLCECKWVRVGIRRVQRAQAGESRSKAHQVIRDMGDAVLALQAAADQLEQILENMAEEREDDDGQR